MIERVSVRNLKRFAELDCTLGNHLVIVGPNNCGKTTLLQAIAFWSEIALRWSEYNPDLAREEDENYPSIDLHPGIISSIPLVEWDQLWPGKDVSEPASVQLRINGEDIGFELLFEGRFSVRARPMQEVPEANLERIANNPITPVFIPPMSGVGLHEPRYEDEVIPAMLARGQGGTVLRNLLLRVSRDADGWAELQSIIHELFGYELTTPSAGAAEIFAGYRERPTASALDFSSAASGFLQIVMIYAAIFQRRGTTVLIDEPDAHLHIVLQDRLYRDLRDRARSNEWQLIVATHSESVIREARSGELRLLSDGLIEIQQSQRLVDTLRLDNLDLMLARQFGRILYVEGKTDLQILRTWAAILQHPLSDFLDEPYWKPMAEEKWNTNGHFNALRLGMEEFRAVELCDRNDRPAGAAETPSPEGMLRIRWLQYEIENYLIHPEAILRWIGSLGDASAVERANEFMKLRFPPAIYDDPFGADYFHRKGKDVLREVCDAARISVGETEYCDIATGMNQDEIHPEVIEKLNAIAKQFAVE